MLTCQFHTRQDMVGYLNFAQIYQMSSYLTLPFMIFISVLYICICLSQLKALGKYYVFHRNEFDKNLLKEFQRIHKSSKYPSRQVLNVSSVVCQLNLILSYSTLKENFFHTSHPAVQLECLALHCENLRPGMGRGKGSHTEEK